MENLTKIKDRLETAVLSELENNAEQVNTVELGAVVDMIKDLADAMYHCSIVKAMEKSENEWATPVFEDKYYTPHSRTPDYSAYRGATYPTPTYPSRKFYTEKEGGYLGKSGHLRQKYFETDDPSQKMQSLDEYTKSLHEDLEEMISGASENEKAMLRNKLAMISQRI